MKENGTVVLKTTPYSAVETDSCGARFINRTTHSNSPVFKSDTISRDPSTPSKPAKEPQLKASEWYKKGEEAFQEKDYVEAAGLFSKAINAGEKEK